MRLAADKICITVGLLYIADIQIVVSNLVIFFQTTPNCHTAVNWDFN